MTRARWAALIPGMQVVGRATRVSFPAILVALVLLPQAAPALPYTWNPSASSILVRTDRGGLFGRMGHRHEIRAQSFLGTLDFDPAAPAATRVDAVISSASLKVIDPELDPEDIAKVQGDMESKVLETAKYPQIRFRSETAAVQGEAEAGAWKLELHGALELHGVTKPVTLPVTVAPEGEGRMRVKGVATLKQKDFGIEPISVGLGAVTVKNQVRIELDLVAEAILAEGDSLHAAASDSSHAAASDSSHVAGGDASFAAVSPDSAITAIPDSATADTSGADPR